MLLAAAFATASENTAMLAILLFVLLLVGLGHLVFNYRPGKPFNRKEMRVFDKYENFRGELDEVKTRIAPPPAKPDYNLTVGFNAPKGDPTGAEGTEKK
jgi:hypothetical protein